MTVEKCVSESLVYERAWSRLAVILQSLQEEKRRNDRERIAAGEETDESFEVLILGLTTLKNELKRESNRLWDKAKSKSELYDWGLKNMLSAVIVTAAEDYEVALSGTRNDSEALLIEQFAEILGDKIVNIMARIKKNQAEFVKVARRDHKEIVRETKKNRIRGIDMNYNEHKCPNCGGGLYAKTEHGATRICCARCQLFDIIEDGDGQK